MLIWSHRSTDHNCFGSLLKLLLDNTAQLKICAGNFEMGKQQNNTFANILSIKMPSWVRFDSEGNLTYESLINEVPIGYLSVAFHKI